MRLFADARLARVAFFHQREAAVATHITSTTSGSIRRLCGKRQLRRRICDVQVKKS
jgi:hypothetical protein